MSEIDLFFETMDSDFYHIYVTHAAELFKNLFQIITKISSDFDEC